MPIPISTPSTRLAPSTEPASIAALRSMAKSCIDSALFGFIESDGAKTVSDKVYGIFLTQQGSTYSVETLYGGRGAAKLSSAPKATGATAEAARKAFSKARAEREKKGYSEFGSADELAGSTASEGFALTASMAAKLPAFINDGFARPDRARCWVCPASVAAQTLSECGGDCIASEIGMFPTSKIRAIALEACAMLDAVAPESYGKYDPEEPMGVLLGMWEGPAEGYSMIGCFTIGEPLNEFPIEILTAKHGGFLVANCGTDNHPGESHGELSHELESLAPDDARREEIARAAFDLEAWTEPPYRLDPAEHPELHALMKGVAARQEAKEIGSATPAARKTSKPLAI